MYTCPHTPRPHLVCEHLLRDEKIDGFHFRFRGPEIDVLCESCVTDVAHAPFAEACAACHGRFLLQPVSSCFGAPSPRLRDTGLAFSRESVRPPRGVGDVLAVAPLGHTSRSRWAALTRDGRIVAFDLLDGETLGEARVEGIDPDAPVVFVTSRCGRFAAVGNRHSRHGALVDLGRGAVVRALDRGDYCVHARRWSLAFTELGGRAVLVHATEWNRLDASDAETGRILTPRATEGQAEHSLDYFHSGLAVSRDGTWIADGGWVWHPVGVLRAWRLDRWLGENPFESEDGASVRELFMTEHGWDLPMSFVDDERLLAWGIEDGQHGLADVAILHDVARGAVAGWIPGLPYGAISVDGPRVFVWGADGTEVFDLADGARIAADPSLAPSAWHPGARHFVCVRDGLPWTVAFPR